MFKLIYSGPDAGFTVTKDGHYIASGATIEEALENAYYSAGQLKIVISLEHA